MTNTLAFVIVVWLGNGYGAGMDIIETNPFECEQIAEAIRESSRAYAANCVIVPIEGLPGQNEQ